MLILAVEGSGSVASAALCEDDKVLSVITTDNGLTHSQTLMDYVDKVLSLGGKDLSGVDYLAVSVGPGSFTGLRIAGALIKGLSLSANKPIIPVSSLKALGYGLPFKDAVICAIMDARHGNVYACVYESDMSGVYLEDSAMSLDEVLDFLKTLDKKVYFVGDGAVAYEGRISDAGEIVSPTYSHASADKVAALALHLQKTGVCVDAQGLTLSYIKESSARMYT